MRVTIAARQEMRVLCQAIAVAHPDEGSTKERTREGRLGGRAFGAGAAFIAIKYGLTHDEGKVIADGVLGEFGILRSEA
jgi:hypothetical protein